MSSVPPVDKVVKGAVIALVSYGTYNVTEKTKVGKLVEDEKNINGVKKRVYVQRNDDLIFSIVNGLTQIIMPPIMKDQTFQTILVNPLLASFITTLYKDISGHSYSKGFPLRAYMSGVTASALVELPLNNFIKRF